MSHETPTIEAEKRERTGSRYAQRLRSAGRLPAVIYGHGEDPVAISVDEKEVLKHLHHGSHVMNVKLGGDEETCLVKDLQFGWLGDNVIHLDLTRVNLNEEVEVKVSITWKGEAEEAKKPGAIVNTAADLEVVCTVRNIPDEIIADLGKMEGTQMTIGELDLPEGVKAVNDAETPIAIIEYAAEIEETGEEADVLADEAAEPEVITEAKADDEGEDEKAEAPAE